VREGEAAPFAVHAASQEERLGERGGGKQGTKVKRLKQSGKVPLLQGESLERRWLFAAFSCWLLSCGTEKKMK